MGFARSTRRADDADRGRTKAVAKRADVAGTKRADAAGTKRADAAGGRGEAAPELGKLRELTLSRGVVPPVLLLTKIVLVPFFRVYFRLEGTGSGRVPRSGPVLLASNHRSFLDPFVIGALVRRPVYYVAKRELFERRWQAWVLGALGAFPIDRGTGDEDAMATAKTILLRGDCVLIFPEGTRVRPGPLGVPRRGVGRLALETGATVVPTAVIGTESIRKGWRIRPHKVRIRFGRPLSFGHAESSVLPSLAAGATARIWACIALQWDWLGGPTPPKTELLTHARRQRRGDEQHAQPRMQSIRR